MAGSMTELQHQKPFEEFNSDRTFKAVPGTGTVDLQAETVPGTFETLESFTTFDLRIIELRNGQRYRVLLTGDAKAYLSNN
jgi:hypothetical protein